jgi:MFS family permease
VLGLSLAIGPVIGGVLVDGIGWRSIFWINVPIGIVAIVLAGHFIPESKASRARRLDPTAQALIVVLLASLTYAIIEGPSRGWGSELIVGLFALSALAAGALAVVETRRREPLIDLRFFRSAPFAGANLIAVVAFAALGGFLFLNTLYLQDVRGYSPLTAGLLMVPMAAALAVCARIAGRLMAAHGARLPLILAGPPTTAGALLLTQLTAHTSLAYLVVAYVLFGIGSGLVNAPISNTALSGMPIEQSGVAGAVASTSRQVGTSLGVAITGSLVAAGTGVGFIPASHAAWAVIAGFGIAILALGWLSTGDWALGTARRNGERIRQRSEEGGDGNRVVAVN